MPTSINNQPEPLRLHYSSLWGKQINMPGFNTPHIQFVITPEEKFQDQLISIRTMQTNNSTVNSDEIKNKTQKESTSKNKKIMKIY